MGLLNVRHKRNVLMTITLAPESTTPHSVHVWLLAPNDPDSVVVNTDPRSDTSDLFSTMDLPPKLLTYANGVGPRQGHFTGVVPWPPTSRAVTVNIKFHTRSSFGPNSTRRTGGVRVHAAYYDSPASNGSTAIKVVSEFRRSANQANTAIKRLSQAFRANSLLKCRHHALRLPDHKLRAVISAIETEIDELNYRLDLLQDVLVSRPSQSTANSSGEPTRAGLPPNLGSVQEDSDSDTGDFEKALFRQDPLS